MPTDATGTPTSLGIPTYNVDADEPSGIGFNEAMATIDSLIAARAPLASPTFTGTPVAPTPATADNSTAVATTAFVKAQGYLTSAPVTSVAGKTGAVTLGASDLTDGVTGTGAVVRANSPTISGLTFNGFTIVDGTNVVLGTTTGTKFGTATNQKLGFFNANPVAQPATTGTGQTGFTQGPSIGPTNPAVGAASTFTGGLGATAYDVSDLVLALKILGLIAT